MATLSGLLCFVTVIQKYSAFGGTFWQGKNFESDNQSPQQNEQ